MGQTWAGAGQKKAEKEKKERESLFYSDSTFGLWGVRGRARRRDPDPEYMWGWEGGGGKRGERNGGKEGGEGTGGSTAQGGVSGIQQCTWEHIRKMKQSVA